MAASSVYEDFEKTRIEPALDQWPHLVERNRSADGRRSEALGVNVQAARESFAEVAKRFHNDLDSLAQRMGWDSPSPSRREAAHGPMIMTGHQPVIFHGGIEFKYRTVEQYATQRGLPASAVIIDSDEGDPGAFPYPEIRALAEDHRPELEQPAAGPPWPMGMRQTTFGATAGLYASARLASAASIDDVIRDVSDQLCRLELCDASARFQEVARDYQALAGESTLLANVLIRRRYGVGASLREAPLSYLAESPEWMQLAEGVLRRAADFHQTYNQQLLKYRAARKIRGAANPFPNLERRADRFELPFWLLREDRTRRDPLWVRSQGSTLQLLSDDQHVATFDSRQPLSKALPPRSVLAPRGALITTFLRLLCCDLFVHGLGGLSYDGFTDHLIRAWWRIEPPAFAAVSDFEVSFCRTAAGITRADGPEKEPPRIVLQSPTVFREGRLF